MMPTPHVTDSKNFYLRQFWTYNFNIHNIESEGTYMYARHKI